jgi:hypothetical protein
MKLVSPFDLLWTVFDISTRLENLLPDVQYITGWIGCVPIATIVSIVSTTLTRPCFEQWWPHKRFYVRLLIPFPNSQFLITHCIPLYL